MSYEQSGGYLEYNYVCEECELQFIQTEEIFLCPCWRCNGRGLKTLYVPRQYLHDEEAKALWKSKAKLEDKKMSEEDKEHYRSIGYDI